MVLRDFQENKDTARFLYSWPSIIIVLILCILALFGVARALRTELALRADVENLKKKIAEAEESKKTFEEKLAALRSPEGLEREARGKFNLIKEGEEVVIFLDDSSNGEAGSIVSRVKSFWENILRKFGF